MPKKINKLDCVGCGNCQGVCIIGCITEDKDMKRTINESACVDCGACKLACPKKCIS